MILKLLKVKNVGRFKSFASTNDDLAFAEITVIFGYNTYGKSTLTAVFHSLKKQCSKCIYGRKTFGSTEKQEIEVLNADRAVSKFFDRTWANEDIEIFDNDFISRNVFYGDHITKEQQSSLYQILIGEDVRKIKDAIEIARKQQVMLERLRDIAKGSFSRTDLGSFDDFVEKANDSEVEPKIQDVQEKIKRHENLDRLKVLVAKTPLKSKFGNFKTQMSQTLDLSVEKSINQHIEKNWRDTSAPKDFLSRGLDLLKEDGNCVFCGQDISPVQGFVEELRNVFSLEYKRLKESVKDFGDRFIAIDLEKAFLEFEASGLMLKNRIDCEVLFQIKANIDAKVVAKQNDLNLKIDLESDSDFANFLKELSKLDAVFSEIETQPLGDAEALRLLKVQLKSLQLTQFRFSKEGGIGTPFFRHRF